LVIVVRAEEEVGADEALVERLLAERGGTWKVLDVGAFVLVGDEGVERLQWRVAAGGRDDALPRGCRPRR
jgi:hypothetical protein